VLSVSFWHEADIEEARTGATPNVRFDFGPIGRLASTFACTPDSERHDFRPLRQDLPASASTFAEAGGLKSQYFQPILSI
jgi:hypothetical protein